MPSEALTPFEQLDFLYMPSRDVAADLAYLTEILGGKTVFAIEAMGTRVAAVQLTPDPPLVLLADHVDGERPILVYRWPTCPPPWPTSRRAAGSASTPSRSLTVRAAHSKAQEAIASRCTSAPARRSPPTSPAAATSEPGKARAVQGVPVNRNSPVMSRLGNRSGSV
jgi:hypothetical protein